MMFVYTFSIILTQTNTHVCIQVLWEWHWTHWMHWSKKLLILLIRREQKTHRWRMNIYLLITILYKYMRESYRRTPDCGLSWCSSECLHNNITINSIVDLEMTYLFLCWALHCSFSKSSLKGPPDLNSGSDQ